MAKNTNLDKDMEEEMEGVDDSDGSGEDEDSGEEDSLSPETLAKISELEQALESNPYNYANHEELVKLLKTGEDFDRLRKARENWSKVFPLTGQLWLEWVADEQKIAATEEEKSEVQNLLERGVRDYLSVDLWLERCMVGMQGIGTSAGAAQSRRIFEEAIAACGLHCGKGSLVWDAYREMETALVSLTAEGSEEHLKAKELVSKLWIRQLRQPLLGMESTLKEYKEWCGKDVDKGLLADYQKARQRLKKREPLESSLLNTEGPEQLEIFRQYAAFEKEEGEPARVQCLYERAVAEHCLVGELWEEYLAYMESTIKIGPVVLPVYARALRNCPWSVELWCAHLRALERYEKETSEVTKVFEQALEAGFSELSSYLELWLTFIDYKRRGTHFGKEETDSMRDLRTVFERARIHLGEVGGDPGHEVAKYQANLEADQYGCMDVARQIWAAILQTQPFTASLWMDFIQLEKTYGDKKHLRKAFQRALEKTYDQPEIIAKAFLQFEREEGSLEAWEQCRKQCKARLARVDASKEKEKDKGMDEEARRADKVERKKEKDKQYRRDRRQEEAATKRENMANNGRNGVGSFKSKPLAENSKVDAPPGFKPPPDFNGKKRAGVEPPPGFKEPAPKKLKTVTDQEFNELSETKQKEMRTVFLSNLSYEVDDDRIRDTMVSSGPIVEVRLIKKPDGKSKGYAFVEFEHRDSAVAALARDNEQLDGRPMYVSEVGQNKKEGAGFKFKTELEKNKLFVRGLDPSVSQDEVRELFSQYGQLTGVRLVTYRNGHSKGIAFVEFEKEAEAAVALVKTDGTKLKGVALQVALSNPPKKEESSQNPPFSAGVAGAPQQVRSLGGTSQEPGPRGKGRSQLAFTPRVLATSSTAKGQAAIKLQPMKFVKPGGAKMEGSLGEGNGKDSTGDESKSNADFRSMFLK